jgi:hypothetical protein
LLLPCCVTLPAAKRQAAAGAAQHKLGTSFQQHGQVVPRRKVVCAVNSGFKGSLQPNGLKLS